MDNGQGACKCDIIQADGTGQARYREARLSLLLFPTCGGLSRGTGGLLQDLEVTLSSSTSSQFLVYVQDSAE